jgi:hypothetical protein
LGYRFFLAGCFISLSVLRALFLGSALRGGGSLLVFAVIGIAFTSVGVLMMFGRRWLVMDFSRGLLVRRIGLLVPLRTQERPLTEFNAVVLAYDAGDSDSGESYPVRLRSSARSDLVVRTPAQFGESRALAAYLSDFLRLPLIDMSSDHETVVAPGHTQQTLRERLLAIAAGATELRPPIKLRSKVTESSGRTTIVIPDGGGLPVHILGIIFPLVVLMVLFPALFRLLSRATSSPLARVGLLFMVTLLIVPLIFVSLKMMVAGTRKRTTVTASPMGLGVEQRKGWRTHKKFVAADDLLDADSSTIEAAIKNILASAPTAAAGPTRADSVPCLQALKKFVPSRGIVIKSRTELITFGEGLPAEELQYVAWALRKALAGR